MSSAMFPTALGMVPVRRLLPRFKTARSGRVLSPIGIVPVSRLRERSTRVMEVRLVTVVTGSAKSVGGTMPKMVLLARLNVVISLRQFSTGMVPSRSSDVKSIPVTRR